MATALRLLLVEDDPDDAALLLRELRRGGYDPACERVDTPEGLRDALDRGGWDLVISDYGMPRFSGADALRVVRERASNLPFIVVSGTIGEETAVETMLSGADDYVMKGRLARLVPAIERELHGAALRQAQGWAEAAADRRDASLQALVIAAQQLLKPSDWETAVDGVLARLGKAMEVSRIYIWENHEGDDGELLTSLRHEWVAPGVTPETGDPARRAVPWGTSGFGRWAEKLSAGEALYGHTRELPAGEKELLQSRGVCAFACVPIAVAGAWWGVMGFDDSTDEREWSSGEVDVLRSAADTLGAAVQRRRVERQVSLQLERLAGLRAVNTATNASLDLSATLNVLLDHATGQLEVDAADVLLYRVRGSVLEYGAARGFRTDALRYTSLRPGEGLAGQVALERRALSIPDLRLAPSSLARSPHLREEGFVAYYALPLVAKGALQGVLELFHRSVLAPSAEWLDFAHTLAGQAAVAIDNALMFENLQLSNVNLVQAYDSTLEGWSRALDLRDRETEGHTQRVTQLTLRLASATGLRGEELVQIRRGALLHDIGKMGIPDDILHKPGPLTEEEWVIMRLHPVYAHDLLSPIDYLRPALDVPYCHHEKWDGSGYPRGLKGEDIPLAARVFAVVDVWDALRSDRPYRAAWPEDRVVEHIRGLAGSHFDVHVVDVFLRDVLGKQSDLLEAIRSAVSSGSTGVSEIAAQTSAAVDGDGRVLRVLIAEDNHVNQRLAVAILERRGHRVRIAANGREALAALAEEPFDVVLMDVQMPVMNGFEATAAIRESERATGRHTPIVALTAHAMKGDRERCLAAGMDAYVAKPLRVGELFTALEGVLQAGSRAAKGAPGPEDAGAQAGERAAAILDGPALLARMDGDAELMSEMAALFLHECPGRLAALSEALDRGDAEGLERAAHNLKGSLAVFGATAACAAALQLEHIGVTADLGGAAEACAALEAELTRLRPELEAVGRRAAAAGSDRS